MTTTPVGPPTAPPTEKPATAPTTTSAPSHDDQARFSKALKDDAGAKPASKDGDEPKVASDNPSSLFRRREAPDQQRGQDRGDSRGRDSDSASARAKNRSEHDREPAPPTGDAILRNLSGQTGDVDQTQAVQRPAPTDSSLSDMVNQVADRILVGQSSTTGQQEVRILLKDDVLGGTEIRVSENAGAYEITFVAENKDIENFLATRQEQISTALGEKLDKDIKVAVTDRDGTPNQQGDERGRQQGQGGQPNDGRSRNRRSVQDERQG
jgi:hypothetical protein